MDHTVDRLAGKAVATPPPQSYGSDHRFLCTVSVSGRPGRTDSPTGPDPAGIRAARRVGAGRAPGSRRPGTISYPTSRTFLPRSFRQRIAGVVGNGGHRTPTGSLKRGVTAGATLGLPGAPSCVS